MRKNIKNYCSETKVETSVSMIQKILVANKAEKIMMDYVNGEPTSITFAITTPNGLLPVRLPARIEGVSRVMYRRSLQQLKSNAQLEQVKRTAWKNLHDWVDAQMALLQTEMVKMEEIFLPYVVVVDNQTIYERFESGQLSLGSGE